MKQRSNLFKTIFLILFFSFIQNSFAQGQLIFNGDTVNQKDSNGKKHGLWAEYLDENGQTTKKLEKAKFYYTIRYNHGNSLPLGTYFVKNESGDFWKNLIKDNSGREFPILMHGEYYWYTKLGQIYALAVFEKGEMVLLKAYNHKRKRKIVNDETLNQISKINYSKDSIMVHFIRFDKKGNIKSNRYYNFDGVKTDITDTNDTISYLINHNSKTIQ